MAVNTNIDLDRVVFDPEYRRLVIEALNREQAAEGAPVRRLPARPSAKDQPARTPQ